MPVDIGVGTFLGMLVGQMPGSEFVYVTYIKTTPDNLWNALTDPEIMKQWRFGTHIESDWGVGSAWKMITVTGEVIDSGEIVESDRPRLLMMKWRSEWKPEFKAEGYSDCTFDIEAESSDAAKLTVRQSMDKDRSPFIEAVADGWSKTLSNLKTFLETGETVLEGAR